MGVGLGRRHRGVMHDLNQKEAELKEALDANSKLRSFLIVYKQVSDKRTADVNSAEKLYASLKAAKTSNDAKSRVANTAATSARDAVFQLTAQLKSLKEARSNAVKKA